MYHSSYLSGAKEEILANLANFAYDPINYDHFRKLNVVDLFMGKREMQVEFCFSKLRLVLTSHSFSDTLTSTQLQVQTNLDVWMLNGNHCIIYFRVLALMVATAAKISVFSNFAAFIPVR